MNTCRNCGNDCIIVYGSGTFCTEKCARSYATKSKRSEINEKVSASLKGKDSKLNKLAHENVSLQCNHCNNFFSVIWRDRNKKYCSKKCWTESDKFKEYLTGPKKPLTVEQRNKLSLAIKNYYKNNPDVKRGGGKSKWFSYNGIKVQGTYELRTCKILDLWTSSKKIKNWEYTKDRIEYVGHDGKWHNYLLDFKIFENDDTFWYLETKGFIRPNDELKWTAVKCTGVNFKVWFHKDIKEAEASVGIKWTRKQTDILNSHTYSGLPAKEVPVTGREAAGSNPVVCTSRGK